MTLIIERVREALRYSKTTGLFTWRIDVMTGRYGKQFAARAGETAGSIGARGYLLIGLGGKLYRANRLAVFYVKGVWPSADVDHRNTIRTDNRWRNLREVSRSVNAQNQTKPRSNNKSGFLGVCRYRNKWHAQIKINGRRIHLGYFETPESAHRAYVKAKRELHVGCTI